MSLSRFFIILTLLLSFNVLAADHLKPRPKIGLALSGGGARGLAHIGVLKGLEQLQVPIDYIAGTSMGSIIGGLYASGLSIEALRQAVEQEIDWQSVLDYNIERDQLSYREKRSQRRYFDIELGLNQHGLTTPPGFIGGQELFLVLKRLTRSINIDDFSSLPIPFTAVATDLNSGQPHLLKKGNLAWALRASMAVPSAFSPVKMEGRVLADGGIVNNIPVDVVREMGADVVIAVDIAVPLSQVDSNSSLITIAQQSLDVALIQNALLALRQADIVIAPDLTGFSRTDFDQGHTLITRGHQAIRDKTALLTQLAVDAPTYARYRQRLQARMPTIQHAVTPQFIKIKGHQRTAEAFLHQKLHPLIGQKVLFKTLEHTTKQLMSLGEFEQITYDVIENAQGETGLLFEFREKPWGPHYFRLGFNAATQFDDKTELTFLLRHERMNINRLGAEWLNEIEVGSGYLIHSEFYQPLDYHKRYFLAPAIAFERAFTDVFKEKSGVAEYDVQGLRLGVDIGRNFSNLAELRLGFYQNYESAELRVGNTQALPTGDIREHFLWLRLGYDSLDDWLFAHHGWAVDIDARIYDKHIGSEKNYQQMRLYGRHHQMIHPRATLLAELRLATTFNSTPPEYEYFSIGGFNVLAGYPEGELSGRHAGVIRLGGLFNPPGLADFAALDTQLLGLFHVGGVWPDKTQLALTDLYYGGSAALVWNTRFGALSLGLGYTQGGSLRYLLSLGSFF